QELRDALPAVKVRPAPDASPGRWETGTQSHEALAGLLGTFRYLEWVGVSQGGANGSPTDVAGRRERLRAAMLASRAYERSLLPPLIDGLVSRGIDVRGITDADRFDERCPTVSFTMAGQQPDAVAAALGERGISVWHGDFYAYELIRALDLADAGGLVRVGLVHYNTDEEVDRLLEALDEIAAEGR
ncbi:MAG: aminotransferase class V-fold PLP-dependent enzyme, partial [Chloroflexi bacterium]|nr:aminotransferase class V-fold PLP-dependent enzyme [Chloroflexota bacterium]